MQAPLYHTTPRYHSHTRCWTCSTLIAQRQLHRCWVQKELRCAVTANPCRLLALEVRNHGSDPSASVMQHAVITHSQHTMCTLLLHHHHPLLCGQTYPCRYIPCHMHTFNMQPQQFTTELVHTTACTAHAATTRASTSTHTGIVITAEHTRIALIAKHTHCICAWHTQGVGLDQTGLLSGTTTKTAQAACAEPLPCRLVYKHRHELMRPAQITQANTLCIQLHPVTEQGLTHRHSRPPLQEHKTQPVGIAIGSETVARDFSRTTHPDISHSHPFTALCTQNTTTVTAQEAPSSRQHEGLHLSHYTLMHGVCSVLASQIASHSTATYYALNHRQPHKLPTALAEVTAVCCGDRAMRHTS